MEGKVINNWLFQNVRSTPCMCLLLVFRHSWGEVGEDALRNVSERVGRVEQGSARGHGAIPTWFKYLKCSELLLVMRCQRRGWSVHKLETIDL